VSVLDICALSFKKLQISRTDTRMTLRFPQCSVDTSLVDGGQKAIDLSAFTQQDIAESVANILTLRPLQDYSLTPLKCKRWSNLRTALM
jgi:hypothetical protein